MGEIFLSVDGNLTRSDFDHSNYYLVGVRMKIWWREVSNFLASGWDSHPIHPVGKAMDITVFPCIHLKISQVKHLKGLEHYRVLTEMLFS